MDTKQRILSVAYSVFINKGFHNTSMQQLVEAAGLSKGAFYHHFKNKNVLYAQVVDHYFLSFYEAVDWSYYHNSKWTIKEIETVIEQFYLDFVPKILSITKSGMSSYYIMYFEAYSILPGFRETVQKFYENLELALVKAVDNTDKPHQKATSIIAKYEGILFLLAIKPSLKIETLLKQVSE